MEPAKPILPKSQLRITRMQCQIQTRFHRSITDDGVLSSRIIASPLKLLDCAPISDRAAAVLLCNENAARQLTDIPVYLTGIAQAADYLGLDEREALTAMPAVVNAATKVFRASGLTPSDVDVAELHDCFTIAELIEIEDVGFCVKRGRKSAKERQISTERSLSTRAVD